MWYPIAVLLGNDVMTEGVVLWCSLNLYGKEMV